MRDRARLARLLGALLLATSGAGCEKLLGIEKTKLERGEPEPGEHADAGHPPGDGDSDGDMADAATPHPGASAMCEPTEIAERVFRSQHLWPRHDLSACFTFGKLTPEPDFVAHVKHLIAGTWQRSAHLNIAWDEDCDERPHDLVLRLTRSDPTRAELGFPGDGVSREVVLDFASVSDGEILYAVGRALGFGHEYGKRVARETCTPCQSSADCKELPGQSCRPSGYCGDERGVLSVMAAPDCGGVVEISRQFSRFDAQGAARAYGTPPFGSLVGSNGACAGFPADGKPDGADLTSRPCQGTERSRIVLHLDTPLDAFETLRARVEDAELCLTPAFQTGGPVPATMYSCVPEQGADAGFEAVELRTAGELCITADALQAGALVTLQECGSAQARQRWQLAEGWLRLDHTDLCITATSHGAVLHVEDCIVEGAESQGFGLREGEIRALGAENGCVGAANDKLEIGAKLAPSARCGLRAESARFHVRGALVVGGQCLVPASADPSAPIGFTNCDPLASAQAWDYYF